ncbi:Regulator component OS=Streptomyces aurantiogriseus OX=66870 GN=GCM10010251_59670 PE=4 SV=1 [Streptomyces aurantiogriseus]|uniref:Regulator component n=2 Tax=Streptomyces aurantiogriseus TaxID=66870 RepID=A0A918FFW1_9ACTN|nr:hypothetical protein GCM10010251_59670 [Streptomyces aurantiogriseus]
MLDSGAASAADMYNATCGAELSLRSRRQQPGDGRQERPDIGDALASIDIPDPFDVQVFCDRIAAQRGRPLHLHSVPGISGTDAPCGVWIATEKADHVFHEAATSPLHQEHIILHELGHMLLGHRSILDGVPTGGGGLFPDIDPATVVSLLTRASYGTEDERDAERLAGLIAGKAAASRTSKPPRGGVLRRLGDALSDS